MNFALRQAGHLHQTGNFPPAAFTFPITVSRCKSPRSWQQHRAYVVAAAANSMGVLHSDIDKVLYSQDAIAEAVSQLGEYVQ